MGAIPMTDEAKTTDFQRGAEAMRESVANWLMCGCDASQRAAVVAAATTGGGNCGARWHACGRSDCLALIAAEALDLPLPEDKA